MFLEVKAELITQLINQWQNVFVEQPQLHRVC